MFRCKNGLSRWNVEGATDSAARSRQSAAWKTRLPASFPGDSLHLATSMTETDKRLDYLEQQIPSLSAAAVEAAYWQALAAGQRVLVSGEGGIYEVAPDGTQTFVKASDRPLSVPVGTRVRIP